MKLETIIKHIRVERNLKKFARLARQLEAYEDAGVEALVELSRDLNPRVRAHAVAATTDSPYLGGHPLMRARLLEMLDDPDTRLRRLVLGPLLYLASSGDTDVYVALNDYYQRGPAERREVDHAKRKLLGVIRVVNRNRWRQN